MPTTHTKRIPCACGCGQMSPPMAHDVIQYTDAHCLLAGRHACKPRTGDLFGLDPLDNPVPEPAPAHSLALV